MINNCELPEISYAVLRFLCNSLDCDGKRRDAPVGVQARERSMIQIWALYRQSGSDRLEKQPTDPANYLLFRVRTLACIAHKSLEICERCRLWTRSVCLR